MHRRTFLSTAFAMTSGSQVFGNVGGGRWDAAAEVLDGAVNAGQVESAALYVDRGGERLSGVFGKAGSAEAMFLVASISKPMNVAALMTLAERGEFQLDDPVRKFLPTFRGDGRDEVTIRHLLTHVSGLPDQLPENRKLRQRQAPLADFVAGAMTTPLGFAPGTKYQYSSMGILLAAEIGKVISGLEMATLVEQAVFKPLGMKRSAQGLGQFKPEEMVRCQVEGAAAESGSGQAEAKTWDWNSRYWRGLGAPWGGVHASAEDVGRFLGEFLRQQGKAVRPETARQMIRNHNPAGLRPRGLGFGLGPKGTAPGCSEQAFGHGGSTGTLCWADPQSDTLCVILTSLPANAVKPHPRELVSAVVIEAAGR